MKKIELEIVALSHSITQTHSYAVVLGEANGLRRLPIVIGGFEAQAIAVALERIYKLEEGIFFAKLICQNGNETIVIDSRTSDALALAVRASCRIYTYENILEAAGLYLDQTDEPGGAGEAKELSSAVAASSAEGDKDLKSMNLEELNKLLQQVLEQEDYVRAINIRDEINNRKSK